MKINGQLTIELLCNMLFIAVCVLIIAQLIIPAWTELPPREQFSKSYETIHVPKFEKMICWECHTKP